jgi:hypothetical protein
MQVPRKLQNKMIRCLPCDESIASSEFEQHTNEHNLYNEYNMGILFNNKKLKKKVLDTLAPPPCPKCDHPMKVVNKDPENKIPIFKCKKKKCKFQMSSEIGFSLKVMNDVEPVIFDTDIKKLKTLLHIEYALVKTGYCLMKKCNNPECIQFFNNEPCICYICRTPSNIMRGT